MVVLTRKRFLFVLRSWKVKPFGQGAVLLKTEFKVQGRYFGSYGRYPWPLNPDSENLLWEYDFHVIKFDKNFRRSVLFGCRVLIHISITFFNIVPAGPGEIGEVLGNRLPQISLSSSTIIPTGPGEVGEVVGNRLPHVPADMGSITLFESFRWGQLHDSTLLPMITLNFEQLKAAFKISVDLNRPFDEVVDCVRLLKMQNPDLFLPDGGDIEDRLKLQSLYPDGKFGPKVQDTDLGDPELLQDFEDELETHQDYLRPRTPSRRLQTEEDPLLFFGMRESTKNASAAGRQCIDDCYRNEMLPALLNQLND